MRGAVKGVFRPYICPYPSPNENFEYGYPHSNAFLQFHLKLERCKLYKATISDSISQDIHVNKSKCIRILATVIDFTMIAKCHNASRKIQIRQDIKPLFTGNPYYIVNGYFSKL